MWVGTANQELAGPSLASRSNNSKTFTLMQVAPPPLPQDNIPCPESGWARVAPVKTKPVSEDSQRLPPSNEEALGRQDKLVQFSHHQNGSHLSLLNKEKVGKLVTRAKQALFVVSCPSGAARHFCDHLPQLLCDRPITYIHSSTRTLRCPDLCVCTAM